VVIGSWNTIAMRRPRNARRAPGARPTSSWPASEIEPATIRPGGSTSPRIEKPVTVLPEPDSPTSPTTSPAPTSNDTSSTAFSIPAARSKWVDRFLT
jgi:hypothetical protein